MESHPFFARILSEMKKRKKSSLRHLGKVERINKIELEIPVEKSENVKPAEVE